MGRMIDFYNQQVKGFKKYQKDLPAVNATERQQRVEAFIDTDAKKISWSRGAKNGVGRGVEVPFNGYATVCPASYRPFSKQWLYFDKFFNEMVLRMPSIFPNSTVKNLVICTSGIGASKGFSALITDSVPNYHFHDTGQCFPLYAYGRADDAQEQNEDLFNKTASVPAQSEYVQRENISDAILAKFQKTYPTNKGASLTKEDIFYYVYGILHSPEYKSRFDSDLKKMVPRIPFSQDFWAFSKTGRKLAHWHLNYETIEPFALQQTGELDLGDRAYYQVQKMQFAKKSKEVDKTVITLNSRLYLSGIPLEAYDYIVNGKSAIEWVMERYQVTVDKDNSIRNDPNAWATESGQPDYIVNLVKRVVRVSVETVKLVKELPALNEWSGHE
jgi:predicted helicase